MAGCVVVTIVGATAVSRVAVFVPVRVATVTAAATAAAAVSSSVRHICRVFSRDRWKGWEVSAIESVVFRLKLK